MFTFTLDTLVIVQMLIAVILPVLVGLVTTRLTSSAWKAWMLAGLTLLTSLLAGWATALSNAAVFDFGVALLAAIPQFVISVAVHYGLWKPTGVSSAVQNVLVTDEENK